MNQKEKKDSPEIKGFFPETKGNGLIAYHSLDNIKTIFLHPNGACHIEIDYFGTERRDENENIHTEGYQDFLEALRDYREGVERTPGLMPKNCPVESHAACLEENCPDTKGAIMENEKDARCCADCYWLWSCAPPAPEKTACLRFR